MKHEVIICDICGKPIDYNKHRRFKVRMKEFYWARYPSIETNHWCKMDVHDECFQELCKLIASVKEQREKDFDNLLKNINTFVEAANKSLY